MNPKPPRGLRWRRHQRSALSQNRAPVHPAVTADLREISHADTRAAALAAVETFKEKYGAKYARGVACLTRGEEEMQTPQWGVCPTNDALLAFYDFPAEHWDHLRTRPGLRPFRAETRHWRVSKTPFTPIKSVFATVRHRTVRTKGALSQKTARLMVFTLVQAASKKWRKLNGANQLPRR